MGAGGEVSEVCVFVRVMFGHVNLVSLYVLHFQGVDNDTYICGF